MCCTQNAPIQWYRCMLNDALSCWLLNKQFGMLSTPMVSDTLSLNCTSQSNRNSSSYFPALSLALTRCVSVREFPSISFCHCLNYQMAPLIRCLVLYFSIRRIAWALIGTWDFHENPSRISFALRATFSMQSQLMPYHTISFYTIPYHTISCLFHCRFNTLRLDIRTSAQPSYAQSTDTCSLICT